MQLDKLVDMVLDAVLEGVVKVDGHRYHLDSLGGSTSQDDETGRKVQDGKPVDTAEFAKRLKAQNDKIDNESPDERGKRIAGFNKMMNNLK